MSCLKSGHSVTPLVGVREVLTEYDDKIRPAAVYLFKRAIEDYEHFNVGVIKHWALAVDFANRWMRFEANCDDSGNIRPSVFNEQPPSDGEMALLKNVEASPKQLCEIAASNKFNGSKYGTCFKNCQNWVKEMASEMGIKIGDLTSAAVAGSLIAVAGVAMLGTVAALAFGSQTSDSGKSPRPKASVANFHRDHRTWKSSSYQSDSSDDDY